MADLRDFLDEYGFFIFFGTIMFLLVCGFFFKQCDKNKNKQYKYTELREDKPPEYESIGINA
jgi:hypothetical protein